MKAKSYWLLLILILLPTLIQVVDQILLMAGIRFTPGSLLKLLQGVDWLRWLARMLTVLGFPPSANGSAVAPLYAGVNQVTLGFNLFAVVLIIGRMVKSGKAGLAPPDTFGTLEYAVALTALILLLTALIAVVLPLPFLGELESLIRLITFREVHSVGRLGAILLAVAFWWTELRNLLRAMFG